MRQLSVVAGVLALLAVAVAALACLSQPLLSNPGPEAASVLGIVGGVALALAQAARAAQKSERGAFDDALGGYLLALVAIAIFMALTAIGGALQPTCGPHRGHVAFFLLALPVLALQVSLGTLVGRLVRRPLRALLVMLLFELSCAGWLFVDWLREPSFRVASHVFVVVSGDLFRGAELSPATVTFRFGTLCFAAALLGLMSARYPRIRRAGLAAQAMSHPISYAIAGALFVVGAVAHGSVRDTLAPTHADLLAQYGLTKRRGPLVLHADPEALRPRDLDALLADGNLWLERLRARLGVAGSEDIHVFVHGSPDERGRWTGARHVDFALPWRREIHIAGGSVPHRSLGHELAHVLAGELSDGLLRMPGRLLVLHNASIVEGVAVALTPELTVYDGLTTRELAAAMHRTGRAPDPRALFGGVGFFTESPARAYVAAGAMVESLLAHAPTDPRAALRTLYETGSIEEAAGGEAAVDKLYADHTVLLETMELPADAAVVAEGRFSRPSILAQTCDPDAEARAAEIRLLSRTAQTRAALAKAGELEQLSAATLEDLYIDAAANRDVEGLLVVAEQLARINDVSAAEHQEAYGDALWRAGQVRAAHAVYLRAPQDRRPSESARTLLAKRILAQGVLERGPLASVARAALDVLVRTEARQPAFLALARAVGQPSEESALVLSLGRYVLARRLIQLGGTQDAAAMMRGVLVEAILPPVFLEQAALALGTGLLRAGAADEAQQLLFDAASKAQRPATRVLLKDRAERAQRAVAAPAPPPVSTPETSPDWADRLLLGAEESGDF